MEQLNKIHNMDCIEGLSLLPDESIDVVFTSPPYKNSYEGIGINRGSKKAKFHYSNDVGEPLYIIEDVAKILHKKVKTNGFFLLNLGFNKDSGALRPFQIVDRFRKFGWFCPDIIIWHKKNPIPNTAYQLTNAYEFVFVLTKNPTYKLPINNRAYIHNVVNTPVEKGESEHNAAFHLDLAKFVVEKFSREGDILCDCFMGSGTTALACKNLNRNYIGFEINPIYVEIANNRLKQCTISEFTSASPTLAEPKEFNMGYQENSNEFSQMPNGTSDNANIRRNF